MEPTDEEHITTDEDEEYTTEGEYKNGLMGRTPIMYKKEDHMEKKSCGCLTIYDGEYPIDFTPCEKHLRVE